jgi:hypothetical protein
MMFERSVEKTVSMSNLASALSLGLEPLFRATGLVGKNEYFEIEFPWHVKQIPLKVRIMKDKEVELTAIENGKSS